MDSQTLKANQAKSQTHARMGLPQWLGNSLFSLSVAGTVSVGMIGTPVLAQAGSLAAWNFDPATNHLEVTVKEGITPRYFLMARPARIVLELPDTSLGDVKTQAVYPGAVRQIRVAQFQPGVTRIVMELSPDVILAPGRVELQPVKGNDAKANQTRWMLRPLLAQPANPAPDPSLPSATDLPSKPVVPNAPVSEPAPTATNPAIATPEAPVAPSVSTVTNPSIATPEAPIAPKPEISPPPAAIAAPALDLPPSESPIAPTPPTASVPGLTTIAAPGNPSPAPAPNSRQSGQSDSASEIAAPATPVPLVADPAAIPTPAPSAVADSPSPVPAVPAPEPPLELPSTLIAVPPAAPAATVPPSLTSPESASQLPSVSPTPTPIAPPAALTSPSPTPAPIAPIAPPAAPANPAPAQVPTAPAAIAATGAKPAFNMSTTLDIPSTLPGLSVTNPTPQISVPGLGTVGTSQPTTSAAPLKPDPGAAATAIDLRAQAVPLPSVSVPPLPPQATPAPSVSVPLLQTSPAPTANDILPSSVPNSSTPAVSVPPLPPATPPIPPAVPLSPAPVPPPAAGSVSIVEFGQPLPGQPEMPRSQPVAPPSSGLPPASVVPPQEWKPGVGRSGSVLLPAGTLLNLRYPGPLSLNLEAGPPQQEVLLLQTPIQDAFGNVIVPQNSVVIGRFETNAAGSRFITQAISLGGRNVPLLAESDLLAGARKIGGTQLAIYSGVGALAGGLLGGGVGALGGAAAGAAVSYFTSPRPATIQPNQIFQVRLLEALR